MEIDLAFITQEVFGAFSEGDVVEVRDMSHNIIGKGISNYAAENLLEVLSESLDGISTNQKLEVIHRDNWVAN